MAIAIVKITRRLCVGFVATQRIIDSCTSFMNGFVHVTTELSSSRKDSAKFSPEERLGIESLDPRGFVLRIISIRNGFVQTPPCSIPHETVVVSPNI